jgi:hypothetical protein
MRHQTYNFHSIFESDAVLPQYKGSTFRGVFGHALKRVVCALKGQECADCLLRGKCLYALVFETDKAMPPPEGLVMAAPPPPFVIEPPLSRQTHYPAGTAFDFRLLLFGAVNDNLPYFIYAFEQMGQFGVGRRIEGRRGRFRLESVTANGETIYAGGDRKLRAFGPPEVLTPRAGPISDKTLQLKLSLETPLRFKADNHFAQELPFYMLVRTMIRRADALQICYGAGQPDWDHKGMVARADAVRIAKDRVRWFDWRRYSARQESEMRMGGLVGEAIYEGPLSEYRPLIEFCEKVHIGKQTTFGLGKLKTEWEG